MVKSPKYHLLMYTADAATDPKDPAVVAMDPRDPVVVKDPTGPEDPTYSPGDPVDAATDPKDPAAVTNFVDFKKIKSISKRSHQFQKHPFRKPILEYIVIRKINNPKVAPQLPPCPPPRPTRTPSTPSSPWPLPPPHSSLARD